MYNVFDCSDEGWTIALKEMPKKMQDVYFTREYYNMYERNGDGSGRLFYYSDGKGNSAIYPFMLNKIYGYSLDKDYYDIETAYGYGGPISNCMQDGFLDEFEECFVSYCKLHNVVAEFIRFHPFMKNETFFKQNIIVQHNRQTVYLDLTKGIDKIWSEDIKSKNRNTIKKARKNGLYVEIGHDYENFKRIYRATMKKVGANDYFYFGDNYFLDLKNNANCLLFDVKKSNDIVASAVFMSYGEYFHYHLAGSVKDALVYSPNNLMLWESIRYAVDNGFKYMHFGGGTTNSEQDSLLKFKSSFSKSYKDFYIGRRIHNEKVYSYLIKEWEKATDKRPQLLLQYKVK